VDRRAVERILAAFLTAWAVIVPLAGAQPFHAAGPPSLDTISYLYGINYRTPGVVSVEQPDGADIGKHTIAFLHLDAWRLGSNLIDVNLRISDHAEPAAGGGTGAAEVYAILRSTLSFNRIGKTRRFTRGPLQDVGWETGFNLQSKNSDYAANEKTLYLGPTFRFAIPRGFLTAGVHYRKEWNHNGLLGTGESYSPNLNVDANWSIPVTSGRVPLTFAGFATVNTPKGLDSFGKPTATEILIRPRLMVDVGSFLLGSRGVLEAGGGIEYWHNLFGKRAGIVPGADQLAAFVQLTVRLTGGH
jgi:hypothetical protein